MIKKMLPLAAVTALLMAGVTLGCTPEARQDVGEAGSNIGQAAEKSAEGTAEAASKAGGAVVEGTKEAGEAVAGAAGTAVDATKAAGAEVGEAVGGAAKSVQKVGAAMDLTPSVKAALVKNDSIDASTINVNTNGDAKQVILEGTIGSEANKKLATKIAQDTLTAENSDYKVVNRLTIKK